MSDLLQRLWDEYVVLCQAIEEVEESGDLSALSKVIMDTDEMQTLRSELRAVGVQMSTNE